jgi:hypothetical protein
VAGLKEKTNGIWVTEQATITNAAGASIIGQTNGDSVLARK